MERYLIIVARDRPNLLQNLIERRVPELEVILDRRDTARPPWRTTRPTAGAWDTTLEKDGYIVVPTP